MLPGWSMEHIEMGFEQAGMAMLVLTILVYGIPQDSFMTNGQ